MVIVLVAGFSRCDPDEVDPVRPAGPVIIDEDLTTDRTLTSVFDDPDIVDYLVTDLDWRIEAGLTVEPGVRIAFAAGARMFVTERGFVLADGDPTQQAGLTAPSITFEGEARNRGHWRGIVFYSADSRNLFNEVEIAHTGSGPVGISDLVAAVSVERITTTGGQLALTNTHLRDGLGYGLLVPDGNATRKPGVLRACRGVRVSNMSLGAMRLDPVAATVLQDVRGLAGNGFNGIEVNGLRIEDPLDLTWPSITGDFPYKVVEGLTISGSLRLSPGVNVQMAAGESIVVQGNGSFSAEGRADAPVTIVGEVASPGHWGGIAFLSPNPRNRLAFCTVSHGGLVANTFIEPALVGVSTISGGPSFVSLTDVTLSMSAGCGVSNGKAGRNQGTVEMTRVTFASIAGGNECGS